MPCELILDQAKIRIGPDQGDDTDFLAKRIGEIICGGYDQYNPSPKKRARGDYTLQPATNNHWLFWDEERGCWKIVFRYSPQDETFLPALKIVLESIITIIP